MAFVKKMALCANVDRRPRKPIHSPGYVMNFKVGFLCTGTTKELENLHGHYFLPPLKDLFLANFKICLIIILIICTKYCGLNIKRDFDNKPGHPPKGFHHA